MKKPVPTIQPAATTTELHIDLIKSTFDKWEHRIEGSPTWEDIDQLMCAIIHAVNPERSHG